MGNFSGHPIPNPFYLEVEPELEAFNRMLLSVEHGADQLGDQRPEEDVGQLRRSKDEVSEMRPAHCENYKLVILLNFFLRAI